MDMKETQDNIKNFSDYVKESAVTDNVVNTAIIISSFMAGNLTYKMSKKTIGELCYLLNMKSTGSRALSFVLGCRITAKSIYCLSSTYETIKKVVKKNGRG